MASSIQPDFPKAISGDLAWTALDFEPNEAVYTENLSENDILVIEATLNYFQGF